MNTQSQQYNHLVLALTLALTAPTNAKSKHCGQMAEGISMGMTPLEVESAKSEALANAAVEAKTSFVSALVTVMTADTESIHKKAKKMVLKFGARLSELEFDSGIEEAKSTVEALKH